MSDALPIDATALAALGLPLDELERVLSTLADHRKHNRMEFWTAFEKQQQFFTLGKKKKQRLLSAGNQFGKSEAGAYETACHLTGLYPPDWQGHRWGHPVDLWMAGVTTMTVRDIAQTKLCGTPGDASALGTGFIPRHCFVDKPTIQRNASVGDCYEMVKVWHHDRNGRRDGVSTGQFKSYEQGRTKFQGPTRHGIWWDEEPPMDVYIEGEARYSAIPDGRSWMTFTPAEGYTSVVSRFFNDDDPNSTRGIVIITLDDVVKAGLWTEEMVADAKSKYPTHEWPARLYGEPKQGVGRVFITDETKIIFPRSQIIAPHWALLWGIDFGITHPFAALLAAIDREADTIYLLHAYRAADQLPLVHSEAIRRIAASVPIAWPHDGHRREAGTGQSLAKVYKALDLRMLPTHAHWPDGSNSTEAAVLEMQQRFADGRLRVHEDLGDFLEEYRGYHRELDKSGNSVIVHTRDDLISCAQKIMMAKRFAKAVPLGWIARPPPKTSEERNRQPPRRDPWGRRERVEGNPWQQGGWRH